MKQESDKTYMLNEERRRLILEILGRDGRVTVRDLAARFSTSTVTIRKDLDALHEADRLHRTHGGALPVQESALTDLSLQEKEKLNRKEKHRIAMASASLIHEGQSVVLDSGTTTTAVARAIRRFHRVTVITNAVNIAVELANTGIEVILTGGVLRENSFSLVGPLAERSLRLLSADILFLGVDGFDVQFGLTTPNTLEASVNRVMMEIARRTVVVCDSSKFGHRSLCLIAPPSAVHQVITDDQLPEADQDVLTKMGVEVTLI
jgi:DeoR family transcriptional regulator, aga operon transcriptional repressor